MSNRQTDCHESKNVDGSTPEENLRFILHMTWRGNSKAKRRNLWNYKSHRLQICKPSWDPQLHLVCGLILPKRNPIWLQATILKNRY